MFHPFAGATPAPSSHNHVTMPITGDGTCLTFAGTFSLQTFVATSRGVGAVGALTGTMTDSDGAVMIVVRTITLPVTVGQASPGIVRLDLGPKSIDLLGLQVTLSRIALEIVPEPSPILCLN